MKIFHIVGKKVRQEGVKPFFLIKYESFFAIPHFCCPHRHIRKAYCQTVKHQRSIWYLFCLFLDTCIKIQRECDQGHEPLLFSGQACPQTLLPWQQMWTAVLMCISPLSLLLRLLLWFRVAWRLFVLLKQNIPIRQKKTQNTFFDLPTFWLDYTCLHELGF